jgi:hypothetical protein
MVLHFFGLKFRPHSRKRCRRDSKAASCSLSLLPYTMKSSRMCNTPSIPSIVPSIALSKISWADISFVSPRQNFSNLSLRVKE